MSHRAIVKTVINDFDMLKKTIKDLGYSYLEGQELIGSYTNGWSADERKADLIMEIKGRKDMGFRKNADGFYSLVGDFYGLGMTEKQLSDKVAQRYSVNKIRKEISNSSSYGINSLSEQVLPNGEIVLEGEIDEQQILA